MVLAGALVAAGGLGFWMGARNAGPASTSDVDDLRDRVETLSEQLRALRLITLTGGTESGACDACDELEREFSRLDLPGGALYELDQRLDLIETDGSGLRLMDRVDEIESELRRRRDVVSGMQTLLKDIVGDADFRHPLMGREPSLDNLDRRIEELERELDSIRFSARWR